MSGCCRNQYSRNQAPHLESWRTQVYYASGPRGVNTPSFEPWTKGLQSFYTQTGMIKWVCRFSGLGDCKQQDEGEWDKLQFLVLWVPTFWDCMTCVIQVCSLCNEQVSYRGRRNRRLYKILTFPLHSPLLILLSSHVLVGHSEFPVG